MPNPIQCFLWWLVDSLRNILVHLVEGHVRSEVTELGCDVTQRPPILSEKSPVKPEECGEYLLMKVLYPLLLCSQFLKFKVRDLNHFVAHSAEVASLCGLLSQKVMGVAAEAVLSIQAQGNPPMSVVPLWERQDKPLLIQTDLHVYGVSRLCEDPGRVVGLSL